MSDFAALPDPEHEAEGRPLPVLAEPRPIRLPPSSACPPQWPRPPAGFLLGVATFLLVRVLRRPRARVRVRGAGGRSKKVDVAGTRSFLVDVHLLKDR